MEPLMSAAGGCPEFRKDVAGYAQGSPAERIRTVRHAPRIKVLRLLAQLLSEEPDLEIEHVSVDAWSGCSDFRGTITVTSRTGVKKFRFHWDCSWRAEQQGWFDAFNLPDQIRAAREFGWRCFSLWQEVPVDSAIVTADVAGADR